MQLSSLQQICCLLTREIVLSFLQSEKRGNFKQLVFYIRYEGGESAKIKGNRTKNTFPLTHLWSDHCTVAVSAMSRSIYIVGEVQILLGWWKILY